MNRDALVVGINQYPFLKDSSTSKAKHLNTPANDAEAITLRLEEYGGFRVRRLPESIQEEQRRVDPKKLVQGDALYEAIIQLFNPVGDSIPQTALLYFAGHGLRRNLGGVTEGFLATSDSDPRKNQWGVSLRWLRELLQKSPVQQQIVWLDCCNSGELLNFAEADLGTAAQGRTRFFIAAAREFEPAEENIQGQHGVFSHVLWEGLDPRRQPEGVVNNDRLIEYIDQTLKGTPQQPIWYNPNCEIILTGAREEVFVSTPDGICPYKGLRFFDVEDAPYFYGREALTQKLIERVQVGKGNFLAVLGVSGSGKSSLLRAGLIYQLRQQRRLPGTEQWKIRIFTPGEQPLVSLATAFLDEEVTDIERAVQLKAAEEAIAQGATGLARLIRASKSPRTVLVVDQFEAVFTVCQSQIDRQQFICSLLDALKQTGDKLCLIFAMRDDFLGKCAAYRELADLIQANLVMVTPMNAQELRQAIVEPAKKLGRKVEENLICAILKDLGVEAEPQTREPEPGMLPLLSYTLEQLWQRQTLNWLKLDSYNKLGGVQKTLENLAERAYKELSVEERRVTDQIFIKLTQLGERTPDTRKQVPQQDLVTHVQSANLIERVIQKLAQAKLIVTSEQRKGQEKVAVVDVAHEALIRHWSRLRELLDNNREAIRIEQRIQTAAVEWRDQGKSKDYLLTGLRLAEAEKFLQDEADIVPLSSLAKELIKESRKERDHLVKQEQERRQRETEQQNRAIKGEIQALTALSETSFLTNDQLGALIACLKAGRQLTIATWITDSLRIKTIEALRQVIFGIKEWNRLQGHSDIVYAVSFSIDGRKLVSASADKTIKLWKIDGTIIHTFKGHQSRVRSVSFSPDGQTIVSASDDKTVKLWKIDGTILQNFAEHQDRVYSASFSPDGQLIASASADFTVKLWKCDGTLLHTFNGHNDWVRCVTFSPNGKLLASASSDQTINLWNINGTLIKTFKGHHNVVYAISFSPDGQKIVSVGSDKTVKLWKIDGTVLHTFEGHKDRVYGVIFSPDGKTIASASDDKTVKLWRTDGTLLYTFEGHKDRVYGVGFSPNGQTIASASSDFTIKLWKLGNTFLQTFKGHTERVWDVKFSSSGHTISSVSDDKTLRIWQVDGTPIRIFPKQPDRIYGVNFSSDGQLIASSSFDKFLRLWTVDGKLVRIFEGHTDRVYGVSFSPNSQFIASGSDDRTVRVWKIDGKVVQTLEGHTDRVYGVCFSPDGQLIASASFDKTIRLWKIDGKVVQTLEGHTDRVYGVCFSPDGQLIASASFDKTIRLWKIDGKLIRIFYGHTDKVYSVCFSPDGQMVVSASTDKTVKLWRIDGKLIRTFTGHTDKVYSACFSPEGKSIVSASADRTVKLWRLDSTDGILDIDILLEILLKRGCNWARNYLRTNPNISKNERHLYNETKTE
ncbi:caspase family protein [Leptolyngbya sp. FACHB-671]|uniref:nSTAND1 domain-containing NTPase n=1 Tax=Leptolyngbya sp. FACHB-671 TaxID=2692812 RepID=UPI001686B3B6|nr:AAA family ATPase [Leptolyngbya sp. FACHB-671]MBD2066004.1 caspase family protein [Leptolyngbya sp. FACHB-671]